MRTAIDEILRDLEELIRQNQFEELESDTLEIKPVPADNAHWNERYKSVNAFLNTRGGILLLGIKEEGQGDSRRYVFTGYQDHAEPKLRELHTIFKNKDRGDLTLADCFPAPEIRPFLDGRIALVFVDELPAEQKYCFYRETAYKRILTGDTRLTEREIADQEEYKQEAWHAREIQPISTATLDDLDVDKLNHYIQLLNSTVKVETIKPDIESAISFLERKRFVHEGKITTLGLLVCGRYPADTLGFRCQLHGYVDIPDAIAQDKQDFADTVLPLMESGLRYVTRNIQVGVSARNGGRTKPQYPDDLLRETINNALAHRDYSLNRHVIIAIKPNAHLSIQNPGTFRPNLLLENRTHAIPFLRIIPEAKPRNPRLADVLRVYRKWEGKGIGMATLVNLCLQDEIDLPYYRLHQDEVRLVIGKGELLDNEMERLFTSFDAYLIRKLDGLEPTRNQMRVLAYLIKSERANRLERHTILLTPDNNHFAEIRTLEQAGLIARHPQSPELYPIYAASRELMQENYNAELRTLFGENFDMLNAISKEVLNAVYRHQHFSRLQMLSAQRAGSFLWTQQGGDEEEIREFNNFTRKIRNVFNRLEDEGFVIKQTRRTGSTLGYTLNENYRETSLL